jgi:hypothetical protein
MFVKLVRIDRLATAPWYLVGGVARAEPQDSRVRFGLCTSDLKLSLARYHHWE